MAPIPIAEEPLAHAQIMTAAAALTAHLSPPEVEITKCRLGRLQLAAVVLSFLLLSSLFSFSLLITVFRNSRWGTVVRNSTAKTSNAKCGIRTGVRSNCCQCEESIHFFQRIPHGIRGGGVPSPPFMRCHLTPAICHRLLMSYGKTKADSSCRLPDCIKVSMLVCSGADGSNSAPYSLTILTVPHTPSVK